MILGLFPELAGAGGVQRAGRLTAAALASFAACRGEEVRFLSLNDPAGEGRVKAGLQEICFRGFARSKRSFAAAGWSAAGQRPNLVVALHPNLAPISAGIKLRSPRTRTVVFAHGIEVWKPLRFFRRWSLARADLVLAPSEDTIRQVIEQQGLTSQKVGKLAWSLGPEFDPHSAAQIAALPPKGFPDGRVILAAGRWDAGEAYKGADHLIAALPSVLRDVPDGRLVLIGEGTDLPRLKRLADGSGVADRIDFLPFLEQSELQAAYGRCEVFALPSRGEGFGLVFLEAMSHGKPVIGGAHGGVPDIIEDGACGFLVSYGAVGELADRLRKLLTDEPLRRAMGEAARKRVLEHFTFQRFSSELASRLEGILTPQR